MNIQKYINFEKFIAQKIFVLEQPSLPHWEEINKNALLGKKSKLFRFFDTWGRNPVFQFSLEKFEEVWDISGPNDTSDETNIEK